MRLPHRSRLWLLLSLFGLLAGPSVLAACSGLGGGPPPGTPLPTGMTGSLLEHVHYLDMTDAIQPDPDDPTKKLLAITVHVHADEATEGVVAMTMLADPGTGPLWPHPGYPGGSPDTAAQKVSLSTGDGQIDAKFPLRSRAKGKVEPNDYNIQSGGFYDVSIYGGGLPATSAVQPVAAFQTNRQYALPDFGGPPPTITPTPIPTVGPTAIPTVTVQPSPTPYPTIPPTATATPLPPPFEVGVLAVQVHDHLDGVVGVLPGVGGASLSAPPGQTYVVAVFVVRRDLPAVISNPLPTELSLPNAGPWNSNNAAINRTTGSLAVILPPYGPVTISYDPRSQALYERLVAAQVWLVPTVDAADPGAFRFDSKPASAYPLASVAWVNPGFPYHLKDLVPLTTRTGIQVLTAEQVADVTAAATPAATPVPGAAPSPGLRLTLAVSGGANTPVTLRLRLVLEDGVGLRSHVTCPVQNYPKLTNGQTQQFTCVVAYPAGSAKKDFHLGVTGTVQGLAIPIQWVALGF